MCVPLMLTVINNTQHYIVVSYTNLYSTYRSRDNVACIEKTNLYTIYIYHYTLFTKHDRITKCLIIGTIEYEAINSYNFTFR